MEVEDFLIRDGPMIIILLYLNHGYTRSFYVCRGREWHSNLECRT